MQVAVHLHGIFAQVLVDSNDCKMCLAVKGSRKVFGLLTGTNFHIWEWSSHARSPLKGGVASRLPWHEKVDSPSTLFQHMTSTETYSHHLWAPTSDQHIQNT